LWSYQIVIGRGTVFAFEMSIWEYTGKSVRLCQLNLLSMSYSTMSCI
jgi:hypothetical protein